MIEVDVKRELQIIAFGIIISYLILATNNFIWNTYDIFNYEYCPGDHACLRGVPGIFLSVAVDPRDEATIIFGGILIWILVNIFDLAKLLKFKR